MEPEFPSNSKMPKEQPTHKKEGAPQEKKVEKVVTGEVTTRKRPLGKRLSEQFFGGDLKTASSYVWTDILVPAFKDTVADSVSQGIEKILFGEARSRSRRGGLVQNVGYTAYNRMSNNTPGPRRDPRDPRNVPPMSRRARATHNFDEIILETRPEANDVLDQLYSLVSQYEVATVADLYEMVGLPFDPVDTKWGWDDLRGSEITRVRTGYLIDLPRPDRLD